MRFSGRRFFFVVKTLYYPIGETPFAPLAEPYPKTQPLNREAESCPNRITTLPTPP